MTAKNIIKEHYDKASPLYKKLWSDHIHHGYYISGNESNKKSTENLIKVLVKRSQLKRNSKVLDVGFGLGGTSVWLAKNYNCNVTGITISDVQVRMAREMSKKIKNKPEFIVMDANDLNFNERFDIVWAVEVISHLNTRVKFFEKSSMVAKKGGKIVIADWFMDENLQKAEKQKYITPIEKGMLCKLSTKKEYFEFLRQNRFRLDYFEDASEKVKKTWDVTMKIIRNRQLWNWAARNGPDFVRYLKAVRSMKKGFDSKKFRYAIMIAEKY